MLDFFEQLRRPLRQREAQPAIDIVYFLCDNRLPHDVRFPPADRDWSVMMIEEARVGNLALVLPSVRDQHAEAWNGGDPLMPSIVSTVGRIKSVHSQQKLVLLQFYSEDAGQLLEYWLPVECLRHVDKPSDAETAGSAVEVVAKLQAEEAALSRLIARRAVLSLCSQPEAEALRFFGSQARSRGLGPVLELLFLALAEAIEVADVHRLGEPARMSAVAQRLPQLQHNLSCFLSGLPKGKGADDPWRILRQHLGTLLSNSSKFTREHTLVHELSLQPDVPKAVRVLEIEAASSLLLLFTCDTVLPANSTITVYADDDCTEVVAKFSSGAMGSLGDLPPVLVPQSHCRLQISSAERVVCRARVIPLHSQLGLAFWLADFMMERAAEWNADPVDECASLLELLLHSYPPSELVPSPLKQSVLRMASKLLASIVDTRRGLGDSAPVIRGRTAWCLSQLAQCSVEMSACYAEEVQRSSLFSGYLQQLVSLMVAVDGLRSPDERLCRHFEFLAPGETAKVVTAPAPVEAPPSNWSCGMCTFENPMALVSCEMCGSPQPPSRPRPKASTGDSADSNQMFHDMTAVMSAMRFLSGDGPAAAWPAIGPMAASALADLQRDKVESRMYVIENLPW
jgi:hypothetical protein